MAKKEPPKETRGRGRPPVPNKELTDVVSARIPQEMSDALRQYVSDFRPKTSVGAVVGVAIEKYLSDLGLWPPTKETKG